MKKLFCILFFFCIVPALRAGSVSLSWDASPSPNIAGYRVYIGAASRTYGTPTTIGNVLTYTVQNLQPGTYYFAVTAFDVDDNESDYSNEVSQIIRGVQPPGNLKKTMPGRVTVTIPDDKILKLAFEEKKGQP